ncbi:hypothetical protein SFRURICE_008429 [Spodoptera frugiperda]|nr:hypothetical protein SFRURICE_008429 [Spodoptera frugiperda]
MNVHGKTRHRSLYGTVRSMVPSRGTPITPGLEDLMYTPPYFYHIPPPPQPLNTYPGRKRRKKGSSSGKILFPSPMFPYPVLHCLIRQNKRRGKEENIVGYGKRSTHD